MSEFFAALRATPSADLSPLCRYIVANGLLYLGCGLVLLLVPPQVVEALLFTSLDGFEPGLVRLVGMSLAVIGWFYVMGGRTGATSFALATVVDRLLVPFVLVPLAVTGAVPPAGVLPVAVLDPVLALGALWIWRRSAPSSPH
jgi:hypothetical protein